MELSLQARCCAKCFNCIFTFNPQTTQRNGYSIIHTVQMRKRACSHMATKCWRQDSNPGCYGSRSTLLPTYSSASGLRGCTAGPDRARAGSWKHLAPERGFPGVRSSFWSHLPLSEGPETWCCFPNLNPATHPCSTGVG